MYLDDVSVYSLVASRIGAVAAEFTDTAIASLQADAAATTGASVAGIARAEVTSRIGASQTRQAQVVRKALVQSTFKELYEYERERLLFNPVAEQTLPLVRTRDDLFLKPDLAPWVFRAPDLPRGDLLDAELELGADAIFRMSAVVSALTGLVDESPELRAAAGGDLGQVTALARIIERLLVGLVPLRGRLVDFEVVVSADGEEVVAHRAILDALGTDADTRLPLYIVGVAEEALFWKDVRRVLFSNSRYRVLCRLARSGTQRMWTPVKLVDVLGDLAPDLAHQLRDAATAMTFAASKSESTAAPVHQRMEAALAAYATELAAHCGAEATRPELARRITEAAIAAGESPSVEDRRRAFGAVTEVIESGLSSPVDRALAAQLRHAAWVESDPALRVDSASLTGTPSSPDERYLDVEFVAIYW